MLKIEKRIITVNKDEFITELKLIREFVTRKKSFKMTLYNQLTLHQKQKMIGELQHAIMTNDQIFHWASELIEAAKHAGIVKNEVRPDLKVVISQPLYTN